MTELTPLAKKLWDARLYAGGSYADAWNNVAEVAEAELASVAESATVRPVRLPTVAEAHQAIADRYEAVGGCPTGNYRDWYASVVLDLVAKPKPDLGAGACRDDPRRHAGAGRRAWNRRLGNRV